MPRVVHTATKAKRTAKHVLHRKIVATLGSAKCTLRQPSRQQNPNCGKEIWFGRETTLTHGSLSLDSQRVSTGQPVNSRQRFGQQWSNMIFYTIFSKWFLYKNVKLTKKGKNRLAAVHRRPDNFWKFPRITTLIGIQQCIHNHTILSMPRLKIINAWNYFI